MPETLREKASKKLKGPDANPSQLGDPISIKAETSETVPTADEAGAKDTTDTTSKEKEKDTEIEKEKEKEKEVEKQVSPSQIGGPGSPENEAKTRDSKL